jgi:sugar transferase EpsL
MKRLFDLVWASLAIMILWPLMLTVALLIYVSMGSPVVFCQLRPGLHGKPFNIYKFRTMAELKDKDGNLLPDELRLGRVGRFLRSFSLDELPQLFNVFKGDLSIVGPRPLLMEYLPLYSERQVRRHDVRPGITGWAQVNGRNALSWPEKFELDVWYVEHQSFWLDMKIIMMTIQKVFRRDGISQEGQATMSKFTGNDNG